MSSDNNWIDPLYLNELLTNEEKSIKKTAKDFCNSELSSIVIEDNNKHFFDSKKKDILPLYNKIVFLTRENFFYKDFKLTDSFSNRIYLIFFHLCFILITLKNKENDKKYKNENHQQIINISHFSQNGHQI